MSRSGTHAPRRRVSRGGRCTRRRGTRLGRGHSSGQHRRWWELVSRVSEVAPVVAGGTEGKPEPSQSWPVPRLSPCFRAGLAATLQRLGTETQARTLLLRPSRGPAWTHWPGLRQGSGGPSAFATSPGPGGALTPRSADPAHDDTAALASRVSADPASKQRDRCVSASATHRHGGSARGRSQRQGPHRPLREAKRQPSKGKAFSWTSRI